MKVKKYLLPIILTVMIMAPHNLMSDIEKIESIIQKSKLEGKIPGLAVVIIKDGNVLLEKGYGYASIEKNKLVTSQTLFELGSTTKAFTALAILKLVEEKKINLEDPVSRFLPWFNVRYNEENPQIKIKDLLFHSSGIPFQTLFMIKSSSSEHSLEETIRKISNISLSFSPSTQFEYATINYDILGLIIEKVTHKSYEDYLSQQILKPLQLHNSFLNRDFAYQQPTMATGYKIGFFKANSFAAPIYKGNTPAGYLISNIDDVKKWLSEQLNPSTLQQPILQSHLANSIPTFSEEAFYAGGWFRINTQNGVIFSHPGNNPNFSSYFAFSPEHQTAVGILSNINSNYIMNMGQSIISLLVGHEMQEINGDALQNIDLLSVITMFVSFLIILVLLGFFILHIKAVYAGKKRFFFSYRLLTIFVSSTFLTLFSIFVYKLPNLFLTGGDWETLSVWGPTSLLKSVYMLYAMLCMSVIFIQFKILFSKPKYEKLISLDSI